ncbi:MAG: isoprenylcysteine carboxylmethyltransferase family protein [Anaerolineales bacterium]|nr:isoprenylcysteine carboxylmethyltransferase family protein [Chloroflexota bacterium]MBL6981810.1 isoprenylcysteine carboxylmethyltransferase family protein [Anaerolineales bacterium]
MMSIQTQLWISTLSFLIFGSLIMAYVRYEYLKLGQLTFLGASLQVIAYGLLMVLTGLSVWGSLWPSWDEYIPDNWAGGLLTILGLVVCALGIWDFSSMQRLIGQRSDYLVIKGVYRYSRNPQYLGLGLLILGFVVSHWSSTAWLAFVCSLLLVGVTIWIEEQHLGKLFGEAYREYCRRVPRIIGRMTKIEGTQNE